MNRAHLKRLALVILSVLALSFLLTACARKNNGVDKRVSRRRGGETASQTEDSRNATEKEEPLTRPTAPVSEETTGQTEHSGQKRLYQDTRVPNYVATAPQWESVQFNWPRPDGFGTMELEIAVDAQMYAYYRELERYQGVENYYQYVNDANNREIVRSIVESFQRYADENQYREDAIARELAGFVQGAITYQYDIDSTGQEEYPRYPIETLYERQGDCEDTSILMAALLKEMGYEVGFFHLPGHAAVALRTTDTYDRGAYYEWNGHRYLYIESTHTGWEIGIIPEEFRETGATLYLIPDP